MRIAGDAADLNCIEWPANMRKEDLDLSDNCCACRCIDVRHADIDFFRYCRGRKSGRRRQRRLLGTLLRGVERRGNYADGMPALRSAERKPRVVR